MTSEFEVKLEESVEALTEKVDTYLNYVVEEWTKENELAIERGLKGRDCRRLYLWTETVV